VMFQVEVFYVMAPCCVVFCGGRIKANRRSIYHNTTGHHNPEDLDLKY
jgi:hypothetical protein